VLDDMEWNKIRLYEMVWNGKSKMECYEMVLYGMEWNKWNIMRWCGIEEDCMEWILL
jgi:hypothetical protein